MKKIKKGFKKLSIVAKLALITSLTSLVTIFMAMSGFFVYYNFAQKDILKSELLTLSQITAQRSGAAIAFFDKKKAEDNLSSLQLRNIIGVACLFNQSGNVFAYVVRSPAELEALGLKGVPADSKACIQQAEGAEQVELKNDSVEIYIKVYQRDLEIGYLYVKAGLNEIQEQQVTFALVVGALSAIAILFTFYLLAPVRRQIAAPILNLGEVARIVNHDKDYSIRAEVQNEEDEIGVAVAAFNNMLTTIEMNNVVLTKMAYYDALTGLGNRRLFMEKLERALSQSQTEQHFTVLMFIDLDKFKPINDNLGHDVGDMLLETVAERMNQSMPSNGTSFRLGGDEFTVVLEEVSGESADADQLAQRVADTILENFAKETVLKGNKISITASLGIAVSNGHEKADHLIKRADSVLYEVKEAGRNGYKVSSVEQMNAE